MKNTDFIPRILTLRKECCICLERKKIASEMIDQPCNKNAHKICKKCIEKISSSIPISLENPEMVCQYPWGECKYPYPRKTMRRFLKEKYKLYVRASLSYKYNDCVIRECPNCFIKIKISEDDLDYMGYNVFYCNKCLNDVCIDCLSSTNLLNCMCLSCLGKNEYTNLYSFNNWFYKNGDDICDYKVRNIDITSIFAIKQIIEKINPDENAELYVKCPVCKISIYKTEACNGVKHCHVEICYACGKFSDIGKELQDHWSARGNRGCPRFDTDPFWKSVVDIKCEESVCFGHNIGSCTIKEHQKSIIEYREFRKKQHLYHHLKSLLPLIRDAVIENLPLTYHKYLPSRRVFELLDKYPGDLDMRNNYLHPK